MKRQCFHANDLKIALFVFKLNFKCTKKKYETIYII